MAGARNYHRWIASRFRPALGARVVEVGAGIGTFSALLRAEPGVRELTLVEPASNNAARLRQRFAGDGGVRVHHGDLASLPAGARAETIVLVNVLEHVEDDARLLREARSRLAPGGALALFVPALPVLFGTMDEAFEHHRRYTRGGLTDLLRGAGFAAPRVRYVNLPGIVPWFVAGRVLRSRGLDARAVSLYDRWVVPWLFALEDRLPPPLGQNLLALATVS